MITQPINKLLTATTTLPQKHGEPLRFDLLFERDLEELCRGWAPSLAETLRLEKFAPGKNFDMYHRMTPTGFDPATVEFDFLFTSFGDQCEIDTSPTLLSLRGRRTVMPSGHVVQVVMAYSLIRDALPRRRRGNGKISVDLVGITELRLVCRIELPKPDAAITATVVNTGASPRG